MQLYRIAAARFIRDLSGEGARLAGGRWNPKGMPVLYTADSAALALLEFFPRVTAASLPDNLAMAVLEGADALTVATINHEDLPDGWNSPFVSRQRVW